MRRAVEAAAVAMVALRRCLPPSFSPQLGPLPSVVISLLSL